MSVEVGETDNKSVNGFNWLMSEVDSSLISQLIQKANLSEVIARLLASRVVNANEAEMFLNPTLREYLPDPFHLLDMEKAVAIIVDCILNKQKIVIFGDYDVDGATSSALLKRYFTLLNVDVDVYIPDRIGEGYGPTVTAFKYLKEQGTDLIITVDCGTAAYEAVEYAINNDMKIVIIDHHLSSENLPIAHALVNPNRFDETSQYNYLAAVGVSFLLAVALSSVLRKKDFFKDREEPSLLSLLDIVAIGTICDVVPLKSLNRAFVNQGLKVLNKRKNHGVTAFCKLLNIDNELTTYHLGYVIGPRINAGGRVGESSLGSKLLSTDDHMEADAIVSKLELYNSERKAIEHNVFEQALAQAKGLSLDDAFIMVGGENWHPGVVGIVAGRLKEIFNKPVAVLSFDGEKGKASCRSIYGVDFGSAILSAQEEGILIGGGGHKMAAGFTIYLKNLPALKSFLHNRFTTELSLILDKHRRYFDAYLTTGAVNLELAKQIEKVGPFGPSNPEPRFLLKNVYIAKINIFAGSHVSCFVGCAQSKNLVNLLKANAFRAVDTKLGDALLAQPRKEYDLVGHIRINRWKGKETVEFTIEDVV